jgi:hypothetical protein
MQPCPSLKPRPPRNAGESRRLGVGSAQWLALRFPGGSRFEERHVSKKQREIIADLGLLGADRTRATTVLDAMLSAQAERERYREMLLRESTELDKPE